MEIIKLSSLDKLKNKIQNKSILKLTPLQINLMVDLIETCNCSENQFQDILPHKSFVIDFFENYDLRTFRYYKNLDKDIGAMLSVLSLYFLVKYKATLLTHDFLNDIGYGAILYCNYEETAKYKDLSSIKIYDKIKNDGYDAEKIMREVPNIS